MRIVFFGCFGQPAAGHQVWYRLGFACGVLKRGDDVLVAGVVVFFIYTPTRNFFLSFIYTFDISCRPERSRAEKRVFFPTDSAG